MKQIVDRDPMVGDNPISRADVPARIAVAQQGFPAVHAAK